MQLPEHRTLRRTLVRTIKCEDGWVDAVLPGWNPHEIVKVKLDLFPLDLRIRLERMTAPIRLFAQVNTCAEKAEALWFENFELAPEPDDADGLC